jgi:hypothetical protein
MAVGAPHRADEATINRDDEVFGDIVANAMHAIEVEVARRFQLGLPIVVSDGNGGVADLNASASGAK